MATLETALMVPILLTVTFTFIAILSVGMQILSLSDATRTVARELARGAEPASIASQFTEREPTAKIDLQWEQASVTVVTSKPAELPVNFFGFNPFTIKQTHTAPREWNP
jgi:Flp pilus assembly protein TadG